MIFASEYIIQGKYNEKNKIDYLIDICGCNFHWLYSVAANFL